MADVQLLRHPPLVCNTANSTSFDTESPQLNTSLAKSTDVSRAELVEDCSDVHSETADSYSDYSVVAVIDHQPVTTDGQLNNIYMNPSYGTSEFVKSLELSPDFN